MKLNRNSIFRFLSVLMICTLSTNAQAEINKNSAYMPYYGQHTELKVKDGKLITTIQYTYVFKFNDERSLKVNNTFPIYISSFEKLEDLEVVTKNPQPDGKIKTLKQKDFKRTNVKQSGIFYDDMEQIEIQFMGLTVGSEATIDYTLTISEAHYTEIMQFKNYIPIENMKYTLEVPNDVVISLIYKNMPDNFPITRKIEKEKNKTVYEWTALDLAEDKSYDNAPSRLYYSPHIIYKVDEYMDGKDVVKVSKSPADLYNWYASNIKGLNKNQSSKIKQLADSIVQGSTTTMEKTKKIYNWVKKNIRYVAFEAGMDGLIPREAELVCNKRYGDCKDMSSLQYSLLRAVGVDAYLTWIGTRRIPYTYTEVPLKNSDNHMIAAVKDAGKWIFLDATDPNGTFGIAPDHIQGKQAMIGLNENEYELAMVPVDKASDNVYADKVNMQIDKTNLTINKKTNISGSLSGNLANQLYYLTDKELEDYAKGYIKSYSNNAILSKHTFPKEMTQHGSGYELSFSLPDYVKELGKEKYVNMLLEKPFKNMEVKEANRTAPVNISLNSTTDVSYELSIPDGYKVSYMPDIAEYTKKEFGFAIKYTQKDNKIICTQKAYIDMPDLLINPNQFTDWNQFIKQLNKAYKESVVLEQK